MTNLFFKIVLVWRYVTDKKDYGLSQYNVEVWTLEDEIWNDVQNETRRIWNLKLMLSKARVCIFLKKYIKGPKIHCLALKLHTGPPNCITRASTSGGQAPGPLDLLVESEASLVCRWGITQVIHPPWLWNSGQTSPEGPTKRNHVLQKFFLKKS